MRHRVLIGLSLAACGAPDAPVRPVAPPPPVSAPTPIAEPKPVQQVFADTDPGFAFIEPDRRTKLVAAFPAIDAALEAEMKKQNLAGFAIGIVIDGELVYDKGFGVTDLETKTKPDGDTVYRIGSISKSFTALALLALRDEGKLGLDDPLARWIPEANGLVYPSRDSLPLTLRQLHSHTSGLERSGTYEPENDPSEAAIVTSLAGLALELAPGTEHRYSNLGFSLLGIAVARAARAPLHDVVAKHILVPLAMKSTVWARGDLPEARLATAYEPSPTGPKKKQHARLGAGDGAGGIYSSVRDMARYVAFQLSAYPPRDGKDDGSIRRASLREAHSTGVQAQSNVRLEPAPKKGENLVAFNATSYGFGWTKAQSCDFDDLVGHGGGIDSYRSFIGFVPSRGVGVVVLTNYGQGNTGDIALRVLAELLRTGALAKRVPRPNAALDVAMKKLIAVQNEWDEAAFKALLDPGRPPDPVEKAELSGYNSLHGVCKSFSVVDVTSPRHARFRVECERGSLEMELDISSKSGGVLGFGGTSRDVLVSTVLRKQADALASLVGKWDDNVHKRLLAKTKRSRADAKTYFDELRANHGACKITRVAHEVFDWRMELDCDRGGALALVLALRNNDPAALEDYRFMPSGRGCPKR